MLYTGQYMRRHSLSRVLFELEGSPKKTSSATLGLCRMLAVGTMMDALSECIYMASVFPLLLSLIIPCDYAEAMEAGYSFCCIAGGSCC